MALISLVNFMANWSWYDHKNEWLCLLSRKV